MNFTPQKRKSTHKHAALKIALGASALVVVATLFGYGTASNQQEEKWQMEQSAHAQTQQQEEQPVVAEPERLEIGRASCRERV